MKTSTILPRVVIAVVALVGLAAILVFALAGDRQVLIQPGAQALDEIDCPAGSGDLVLYPDATITVIPDTAPPASPLEVEVTDIPWAKPADAPAEILWDFNLTTG